MKKITYKKSDFVTVEYLDSKLIPFITKKYLDKRLGKFKGELKSELTAEFDNKLVKLRDGLIFYIDQRLKPIEQKLTEFDDFKDQVLSRLDWLIGRYKKFEDEHSILTGRYSDVQVRLDSHDKRIGILEQKSS